MRDSDLCPRSWLPPASCAHCRGDNATPPALGLALDRPIRATFDREAPSRVVELWSPTLCDGCGRVMHRSATVPVDLPRDAHLLKFCGVCTG